MTPNPEEIVLNASKIIILGTVDSTNNYAMARLRESGAQEVQAWQAMRQTAGRGRMGRRWMQQAGNGLAISLGLPRKVLAQPSVLWVQMLLAVVARQCVEDWLGLKKMVCIKWPNDIMVGDRKAGGLLVESGMQAGELKFVVAGLGVNINGPAHSGDLRNQAVSLQMVTGREVSVTEAGAHFYASVLQMLAQQPQADQLLHWYNEYLHGKGRPVSYEVVGSGQKVEGLVVGIDAAGRLGLENAVGVQWWDHHMLERKTDLVAGEK